MREKIFESNNMVDFFLWSTGVYTAELVIDGVYEQFDAAALTAALEESNNHDLLSQTWYRNDGFTVWTTTPQENTETLRVLV